MTDKTGNLKAHKRAYGSIAKRLAGSDNGGEGLSPRPHIPSQPVCASSRYPSPAPQSLFGLEKGLVMKYLWFLASMGAFVFAAYLLIKKDFYAGYWMGISALYYAVYVEAKYKNINKS
jgi:hypothetical protein